MLIKLIFTILTAALLTFVGITATTADLGINCGSDFGICDQDRDQDGDGDGYRHGYGNGNGAMDGSCSTATALTTEEIESLQFMRELEKLAHDSYLVLGSLWEMTIFDNIVVAEQNHMDALENLFDCFKLTDPVIDEVGTFTDPELQAWFDSLMLAGQPSMMDGLYVGANIEETEIHSLQSAPEFTDHPNIAGTYESLLCASRNHLRAFIRQIEINGGSYEPILLGDALWDIAYSDMERQCGNNNSG